MDLKAASALWSLGLLGTDELPKIAMAVLEADVDSQAAIELAYERPPNIWVVKPLFERMLEELEVYIPAPRDAAWQVTHVYAEEIVAGTVRAYRGAEEIVSVSIACEEATIPSIFTDLTCEYEDFGVSEYIDRLGAQYCQQVRKDLETQIVEEAQKILDTPN